MADAALQRKRRTRLHLLASRLHKWLALLIGAQLLLWFASGAVMSFLPIGEVRGEHLVNRDYRAPLPSGTVLAPPDRILAATGAPVSELTVRMLDGRPVAEVTTGSGIMLFDARSAARLPAIDGPAASRIAAAAWRKTPPAEARATRIVSESPEYRGALPAWRVAFADADSTAVYVSADTGRITAVRTGTWRFYDLFWSLHIMDWKNHEDTNSPWLLGFALGALVLGLAGTVLLVLRWPRRRAKRA